MAGDVDPLEEIANRREVLSQGDGQVDDAEERQVKELVGMEGHRVVRVIAEDQPPSVEEVDIPCEYPHRDYLELELLYDLHLIRQEDLDDGQQV